MSRAAELAREEAERAEAENPDTTSNGGEAEPEPEPEPELPPASAAGPSEADFRKADRLRETYRVKLGALLGDENVAHECALCSGVGYVPVDFPAGTMFTLTETDAGLQAVPSAPGLPPDFMHAEDKETCDKCNGYGETITGSKNPNHVVATCIGCNGNGYKQKPIEPAPYVPPPVAPGFSTVLPGATSGATSRDPWGRPPGHAEYGLVPDWTRQ